MVVIAIILLVDQIVKIWVKTNLSIGETVIQWDAFNITWSTTMIISTSVQARIPRDDNFPVLISTFYVRFLTPR